MENESIDTDSNDDIDYSNCNDRFSYYHMQRRNWFERAAKIQEEELYPEHLQEKKEK